MIAKLVTRCITLDYTDVARPFSSDEVQADINAVRRDLFEEPEKIMMWAHQWLWLAYKAGLLNHPSTHLPWVVVPEGSTVIGKNTLWGIDVEVLEP